MPALGHTAAQGAGQCHHTDHPRAQCHPAQRLLQQQKMARGSMAHIAFGHGAQARQPHPGSAGEQAGGHGLRVATRRELQSPMGARLVGWRAAVDRRRAHRLLDATHQAPCQSRIAHHHFERVAQFDGAIEQGGSRLVDDQFGPVLQPAAREQGRAQQLGIGRHLSQQQLSMPAVRIGARDCEALPIDPGGALGIPGLGQLHLGCHLQQRRQRRAGCRGCGSCGSCGGWQMKLDLVEPLRRTLVEQVAPCRAQVQPAHENRAGGGHQQAGKHKPLPPPQHVAQRHARCQGPWQRQAAECVGALQFALCQGHRR